MNKPSEIALDNETRKKIFMKGMNKPAPIEIISVGNSNLPITLGFSRAYLKGANTELDDIDVVVDFINDKGINPIIATNETNNNEPPYASLLVGKTACVLAIQEGR